MDPSTYYATASGRRNTTGLNVTIKTLPRQDPVGLAYMLGNKIYDLTWRSDANQVVVEIELPSPESSSSALTATGTPSKSSSGDSRSGWEGVFAVVKKHSMNQFRTSRWDIASFAQVSEQPTTLGNEFVVFSEAGQLTEWFTKQGKNVGIRELFESKDESAIRARQYLESLTVSDIPDTRPEES